jgi:hypothetical protein
MGQNAFCLHLTKAKESEMLWQYRTILFEFTKDGLLGDKYVDDEEMEKTLNQLGGQGWELVNVTLLQDGVLSFLKMPAQGETVGKGPAIDAAPVIPQPPVVRSRPEVRTPARVPTIAPAFESEPEPEETSHVAERQRRTVVQSDDSDFIGGIRIS